MPSPLLSLPLPPASYTWAAENSGVDGGENEEPRASKQTPEQMQNKQQLPHPFEVEALPSSESERQHLMTGRGIIKKTFTLKYKRDTCSMSRLGSHEGAGGDVRNVIGSLKSLLN